MTRYRLLLRAYPPGPRRAELLDTLHAAGGARPRVREALDLLAHGLRARLGRPGSRSVVVVAVLVSVVGGFLAGCAALAAGWQATPQLPGAPALAAVVAPGRTVADYGPTGPVVSMQKWTHYFLGGDDEDAYGRVSVDAPGDPAVALGRLEAAGWHHRGDNWVTKDGFAVEVADGYAEVVRLQPPWLTALGVLAALGGALATWLLVGWMSRRTEGHHGPGVLATLFLLLMLPQAALGISLFGSDALLLSPPTAPPWVSLFKLFGYGMFVLALIVATLSVLLAAASKPLTPPPHAGRPSRAQVN